MLGRNRHFILFLIFRTNTHLEKFHYTILHDTDYWMYICDENYSYLIASIGLSFAACLAGSMPEIIPIEAANAIPWITKIGVTTAIGCISRVFRNAAPP